MKSTFLGCSPSCMSILILYVCQNVVLLPEYVVENCLKMAPKISHLVQISKVRSADSLTPGRDIFIFRRDVY